MAGEYAGPSLRELLWREMDNQLGKLLAIQEEESPEIVAAQRGHCLGLAKALAIFINPYDPNVDAIRREAMERWEEQRGTVEA